jgi:cyclopropane-fatty-acyl-phospholipid synthase
MLRAQEERTGPVAFAVDFDNGKRQVTGVGEPSFTISIGNEKQLNEILAADDYKAAMAFVHGEFDIHGDLVAAMRLKHTRTHSRFWSWLRGMAARVAPARLETWLQTRRRATHNIRFHYDRSNDFYSRFLDSRFVYSPGYFDNPEWTLEEAQRAKLELICHRLELRPGERFLDVGCGWGALVLHAVRHYEVQATGCTLSHSQAEYATAAAEDNGLSGRVTIVEKDYREIGGGFEKISSIGMFEHVGRHRLGGYFHKMYVLLRPGGLFVNSGITRPQPVTDDPQTYFLQRKVFPGGELAHLSDVIGNAERAGFLLREAVSMRLHYARTCREWVARLQQNADSCLNLVGRETYRTWLLYLAASALSFENGSTDDFQVLMEKRA